MYNPLAKIVGSALFLFIVFSCTPQILPQKEILSKVEIPKADNEKDNQNIQIDNVIKKKDNIILNEIEIILPSKKHILITKNFINATELSLYKKNAKNISFNINLYSNDQELHDIISKKAQPGKIFIGPLTSLDTKNIQKWCEKEVIFFSFASDRNLANECVFLVNFFPEDELVVLFDYFGTDKKIALLYPENEYGYYISKIIDDIATKSNSLLINKASYKEDLSNARNAIKELGKYELRKYELERQKKILKSKNDKISRKALKKIEKFETIGELDFTHLIIPDYNIRLLQIAPLLPFYDVDPNKIQFVGTGVWDDEVFFYEPSLQGAIFPGIQEEKRIDFVEEYSRMYLEQPIRTATIIYDLVGLMGFINEKNLTVNSAIELLNNNLLSFDGIDGEFSFEKNLIKRKLNILQIFDGKTQQLD